jgi:hypothetical protein
VLGLFNMHQAANLALPPYPFAPDQARDLLREADYPQGCLLVPYAREASQKSQ